MAKKIFNAGAKAPDMPKVRYMRKAAAGPGAAFTDVTAAVRRVELELLNGDGGPCALVRLSEAGEEVWRTVHQSVDEARTQARYEYGVEAADWVRAAPETHAAGTGE